MDIYEKLLKGKSLDELLEEARAEQEKDKTGESLLIQQKNSDYALVQVPQDGVVDKKKEIETSFPYLDPKLIGTKFGRKMIELYEKDERLRNILKTTNIGDFVMDWFIIGRTFLGKCCGERMIKIQKLTYNLRGGVKTFSSLSKSGRLIYCPSCAKAIEYIRLFG